MAFLVRAARLRAVEETLREALDASRGSSEANVRLIKQLSKVEAVSAGHVRVVERLMGEVQECRQVIAELLAERADWEVVGRGE